MCIENIDDENIKNEEEFFQIVSSSINKLG
jgi:hypothetical protein